MTRTSRPTQAPRWRRFTSGTNRSRWATTALTITIALALASCSSGSNEPAAGAGTAETHGETEPNGSDGEGTSTTTGDSFVYPVVATLTGNLAPLLDPQKNALNLAVDEINAEGGVQGRPIELRMEDDAGSPEGAITAFRRLLPGSLFIQQATPTNSVTGTAPLAPDEGILLYGGGITQPPLVQENRPVVFTGWPDSQPATEAMVAAFVEAFPDVTTLSFVLDEQDAAANFQAGLVRDAAEAQGFEILEPISVTTDQVDFVATVDKVASEGSDAVIVGMEADTAAKFLVQMNRAGIGDMPKLAARAAWNPGITPEVAGPDGLRNFWTPLFFSPEQSPEAQAYADRYEERFDVATDDSAAFAYEGMHLIVDMINELELDLDAQGDALAAERQRLYEAIADLEEYTSVLGNPLAFEEGMPVKPGYILQGDTAGELSVVTAGS